MSQAKKCAVDDMLWRELDVVCCSCESDIDLLSVVAGMKGATPVHPPAQTVAHGIQLNSIQGCISLVTCNEIVVWVAIRDLVDVVIKMLGQRLCVLARAGRSTGISKSREQRHCVLVNLDSQANFVAIHRWPLQVAIMYIEAHRSRVGDKAVSEVLLNGLPHVFHLETGQ